MPRRLFKKKCAICRDKMAVVSSFTQFPKCIDCEMKELSTKIEDPAFKELFDSANGLYETNYFLRQIKSKYIRFGSLSEKQVEAFKKVVIEAKNPKPKEEGQEEE